MVNNRLIHEKFDQFSSNKLEGFGITEGRTCFIPIFIDETFTPVLFIRYHIFYGRCNIRTLLIIRERKDQFNEIKEQMH